jgi:hypothetical protein
MKKLELWNGNKDCKTFGVFATFERCCPSSETEANKIFLIIHYSTCRNSFCCIVDIGVSIFELVKHPFVTNSIFEPMTYM